MQAAWNLLLESKVFLMGPKYLTLIYIYEEEREE